MADARLYPGHTIFGLRWHVVINFIYQIMIFDFCFWIICTDWDSSTSPYLSFLKVASLVFSSLTAKEQLHQWIQHNLILGKRIHTLHSPNLHISWTLEIDAEVKNPQIFAMSLASTAWYLNVIILTGRFETEWPQNQMMIRYKKRIKFLCMNVLI